MDPDCGDRICSEYVDHEIAKIFIHPKYSMETNENDISLIRLKKFATINEYIRPIRLLAKEDKKKFQFNGLIMFAAGWGEIDKSLYLL